MEKEQEQEWDANTLCIPIILYHSTTLPTATRAQCMQGQVEWNTQSVSILFFFHQSFLYPIKKCFYLLVTTINLYVGIVFLSGFCQL